MGYNTCLEKKRQTWIQHLFLLSDIWKHLSIQASRLKKNNCCSIKTARGSEEPLLSWESNKRPIKRSRREEVDSEAESAYNEQQMKQWRWSYLFKRDQRHESKQNGIKGANRRQRPQIHITWAATYTWGENMFVYDRWRAAGANKARTRGNKHKSSEALIPNYTCSTFATTSAIKTGFSTAHKVFSSLGIYEHFIYFPSAPYLWISNLIIINNSSSLFISCWHPSIFDDWNHFNCCSADVISCS